MVRALATLRHPCSATSGLYINSLPPRRCIAQRSAAEVLSASVSPRSQPETSFRRPPERRGPPPRCHLTKLQTGPPSATALIDSLRSMPQATLLGREHPPTV